MARKIVIGNLKGGIGKTTLSINLADAFIHGGQRVLLVDADPQGNSSQVYRAEIDGHPTMYDLYKGDATIKEAIQHTSFGDIVPNENKTNALSGELEKSISGYNKIRKMLKEVEDEYDIIIIDTPPLGGIFMLQGFTAADYLIIPTEASTFSISGLSDLPSTYEEIVENTNPDLKILGVVLNNYDGRKTNAREAKNNLPAAVEAMGIKCYSTIIQTDANVEKAEDNSESLFEHYKGTRAANDFITFAAETISLINEIEGGK